MKTSPVGVELIHSFELCELESYPDPGSPLGRECSRKGLPMRRYREVPGYAGMTGAPWTIGWGHTGNDVRPSICISQQRADELFAQDLAEVEAGVNRLVKVRLTQNQFDALVSFAYNCGLDEDSDILPEGLGDSTLLKYVNQNKHVLAAAEMLKWNKSGGRVLLGLIRRRQAENKLYSTPEN